jgi:hypothetical protein
MEHEKNLMFMDTRKLDDRQKEYINLMRDQVLAQKRVMEYMGGAMSGMGGYMGGMGGMGGFMASMVAPITPVGASMGGGYGASMGGDYGAPNTTNIANEGETQHEDANDGNGGKGSNEA